MFKVILKDEIRRRNISIRQAAREVGIAHTSLIRAMEGKSIDLPTMDKICGWLSVTPGLMLNVIYQRSPILEYDKLFVLLERYPELREKMIEAVSKIEDGVLQPEVLKDLLNYFTYRLS